MVETAVLWIGAVVMGLGTVAFGTLWLRDEPNRFFHAITTAVAGLAAIAYATMALGVGTITIDGARLLVPRYVDWALTTPLLILYLGRLAGIDRRRLAVLLVVDAGMVLSGPVALAVSPPATWAVYLLGVGLLGGLFYGLFEQLPTAAATQPASVNALFQKLRNLTVAVWLFYPVVWLVGPPGLGVLLPIGDALVVTYLDVVAKVGFGLIAASSLSTLQRLSTRDATTTASASA